MNFFSIFFFILLIIGIFLLGIMHEKVYQAIYEDYGIKSKIGMDFPNMITIAEKSCEDKNCELAHEINEVIGYHALPFYLIIGLGLSFIIVLIEEKNEI